MNRLVQTKKVWWALGIFLIVAGLGIFINRGNAVFGPRNWLIGNSISWYVGSEAWSALIFAVSNVAVMLLLSSYLWKLGEDLKMPKVYYCLVVALGASLMWLSVFPLGFFDFDGQKSIVSFLHELGSRSMFLWMGIIMILLALKQRKQKPFLTLAITYILYAVFCVVGTLAQISWFYGGILIFESIYIASFMVIVGLAKK